VAYYIVRYLRNLICLIWSRLPLLSRAGKTKLVLLTDESVFFFHRQQLLEEDMRKAGASTPVPVKRAPGRPRKSEVAADAATKKNAPASTSAPASVKKRKCVTFLLTFAFTCDHFSLLGGRSKFFFHFSFSSVLGRTELLLSLFLSLWRE
jgi:hypothetical protein